MEDSKTLIMLSDAHATLVKKESQYKDLKKVYDHHIQMAQQANMNLFAMEEELLLWQDKCKKYQMQVQQEMAIKYKPPTPPPPIQETVYNYVTVEKEVLVPKDVHLHSICAKCGCMERELMPMHGAIPEVTFTDTTEVGLTTQEPITAMEPQSHQ